ncbi:MAG: hypothetical protein WCD35_05345 [Mycobacteriales bacterium]
MSSSSYDYTQRLLRTDPTAPRAPHLGTQPASAASSEQYLAAILRGDLTASLPNIIDVWTQVNPDQQALDAMTDSLTTFTHYATNLGVATWGDVPADLVRDFIAYPDTALTDQAWRLRKNTVHGAYLALIDANLHDGASPAEGLDALTATLPTDQPRRNFSATPDKGKSGRSYTERHHCRPATHDEVLLTRLACRLAGTSRSQGLPAAAVALCTASATTGEAPQVLWRHLAQGGAVALPGRLAPPGREETAISARTVALDPWSQQALTDWQQERSINRPVSADESVLYSGNQPLTSRSAQVCADQAIARAFEIADLRHENDITAGSLRLWAAARHVTTLATLPEGAAVAGVDPLTLHRQITQQGDRRLLHRSA